MLERREGGMGRGVWWEVSPTKRREESKRTSQRLMHRAIGLTCTVHGPLARRGFKGDGDPFLSDLFLF